jgi:hypothetical protein
VFIEWETEVVEAGETSGSLANAEEQRLGREINEEKRHRAMAVMAASIAPRLDDWLVKPSAYTRLGDHPLRIRLLVYLSLAVGLVLAGFVVWAIASRHGALAAYALLGYAALSIGVLAGWIAIAVLREPGSRYLNHRQHPRRDKRGRG